MHCGNTRKWEEFFGTSYHSFSIFSIFFFRYIQIIVIRLNNSALPDPPYSLTSDKISTVNESVPTLVPYVAAQLTVDQANERKTFVIGDDLNYGQSPRRRQRVEKSNERRDRSYMSPKAMFFYNRPLEADSNYSAFQRTFIEEVGISRILETLRIYT
jgi:hypothetical protein